MNNLRSNFDLAKLREEKSPYKRALKIAQKMFADRVDKEGEPYIYHLYFVSEQQLTEDGKVVGLLHDLLEDTEASSAELYEAGFDDTVVKALELLTKVKGTPYPEYIDRLLSSNNEIAIRVKEADMRNNMDPERIARLDKKYQEKFLEKYPPQYKKILEKIGEIENDRHKANTR